MQDFDVAVVGAGYAGLVAARDCVAAGADVRVFEARDRVGGRVHTEFHDRVPLDLGGMWAGPGHRRLLSLASEHGCATYPTHADGDALVVDGQRRRRFRGALPSGRVHEAVALTTAAWRIERLAAGVDPARPWAARDADRLDATTVATWLRRWIPVSSTRRLVTTGLSEVLAIDVEAVSMLGLATYVGAADGLESLLAIEGGAQERLFVDGADAAARAVAAALGDRVRFGSPVRGVRHDATGVTLDVDGGSVRARRVIVAVPPALWPTLGIDPLPARHSQLAQRLSMGSIHKVLAVYDEPFWRADGLSGETVDLRGPVPATFDVSAPGGPGVLCALVPGGRALDLAAMSEADRRATVLSAFSRLLGPQAASPQAYRERSWSQERWSGGGYSGVFTPGLLTSVGPALREDVGRVHWAGTETATGWMGYIEGAIRSGERAARAVVAALRVTAGA